MLKGKNKNPPKQNQNQNKKQAAVVKRLVNKALNQVKQQRNLNLSKVKAPIGVGYRHKNPEPKFSGGTRTTITHREYVGNLSGSDQLSVVQLRVNPSDEATFPWLSNIANSFEKWKMNSMKVEYIPNCASLTQGYMFMYPDYDVNRPGMISEKDYLNTYGAVDGSAWASHSLAIVPKKFSQTKDGVYLVRSPYKTYEDYLLYDPVNIYVGTQGTGDETSLGRLFITYSIDLMIPDPESKINVQSTRQEWNNMNLIEWPASSGKYLPSPQTTSTITLVAGNIALNPSTKYPTGFSLNDYFAGQVTLYIRGVGYDASLLPTMSCDGGTIDAYNSVLADDWGGTDMWAITYNLKTTVPKAHFYFSGALGENSSSTCTIMYVNMATANPKWLYALDPISFNEPTLSLNAKLAPGVSLIDGIFVKTLNSKEEEKPVSKKTKKTQLFYPHQPVKISNNY